MIRNFWNGQRLPIVEAVRDEALSVVRDRIESPRAKSSYRLFTVSDVRVLDVMVDRHARREVAFGRKFFRGRLTII